MLRSVKDHVRLEEAALKENLVEVEFSEDSAQHLFSDLLAFLSRVGTVREDFRLDNGDETVLLADKSVFGKTSSIGSDGLISGASSGMGDLQDSSPFGESASEFVELSSHGGELFETLGPVLFLAVVKDSQSFIDLDAGNNALAEEVLSEVDTVLGGLFGSFLMEDDTGDVSFNSGAEEEHFSISPSVLCIVLKTNGLELLFD